MLVDVLRLLQAPPRTAFAFEELEVILAERDARAAQQQ
jgi:hypothetical protein